MRFTILLLLLAVLVLIVTEARKKDDWQRKKHRSKSGQLVTMDKEGDDDNRDHKYKSRGKGKMSHRKDDDMESRDKHNKKRKYKKHMAWLKIRKDADCGLECKPGEVCISGPIDSKPLCVHKKDLKKSMKLFHRYQKKEEKAWKRFQKKNYNDIYDMDVFSSGNEEMDRKEQKAELKRKHMEKHNIEIPVEKTEKFAADVRPYVPAKPDSTEECSTSQFSQMRTRMMGWFHLLHGQDHLARKEHGGSIKHFYKHVSVKKELREHDGHKCGCLKSAMWQFHQMDKNGDDYLTDDEMMVMVENSLEPCMRPYLTSCDTNADFKLSSDEWCCCFANVLAPCFKKVDEIRRSGEPVTYMPRCDKEGYYMREQCKGDKEEEYQCWCVDYNGNEYKDTLTHGRAHCSKIAMYGTDKIPMA